jgi:hypothetical protein
MKLILKGFWVTELCGYMAVSDTLVSKKSGIGCGWGYYNGGYQVIKKWLSFRERDLWGSCHFLSI